MYVRLLMAEFLVCGWYGVLIALGLIHVRPRAFPTIRQRIREDLGLRYLAGGVGGRD